MNRYPIWRLNSRLPRSGVVAAAVTATLGCLAFPAVAQPTSPPSSRPYMGLCPETTICPEPRVGRARCLCYENGALAEIEIDLNRDGRIDQHLSHYYDDQGRRTFEVDQQDVDFDGVPDVRSVSIYDSAGREMRREVDYGLDDVIDRLHHFEYDERGLLVLVVADLNNDTYVDARWTYQYNNQGHRVLSRADYNVDGDLEEFCISVPPCAPPFDDCHLFCIDPPAED